MKVANISTIKNQLSKFLNYVRQGETVRIFDRNVAIAELVPIQRAKSYLTDEEHLRSLEVRGIIRRGTGKIPKELLEFPKGSVRAGGSLLEALLEERRQGR